MRFCLLLRGSDNCGEASERILKFSLDGLDIFINTRYSTVFVAILEIGAMLRNT